MAAAWAESALLRGRAGTTTQAEAFSLPDADDSDEEDAAAVVGAFATPGGASVVRCAARSCVVAGVALGASSGVGLCAAEAAPGAQDAAVAAAKTIGGVADLCVSHAAAAAAVGCAWAMRTARAGEAPLSWRGGDPRSQWWKSTARVSLVMSDVEAAGDAAALVGAAWGLSGSIHEAGALACGDALVGAGLLTMSALGAGGSGAGGVGLPVRVGRAAAALARSGAGRAAEQLALAAAVSARGAAQGPGGGPSDGDVDFRPLRLALGEAMLPWLGRQSDAWTRLVGWCPGAPEGAAGSAALRSVAAASIRGPGGGSFLSRCLRSVAAACCCAPGPGRGSSAVVPLAPAIQDASAAGGGAGAGSGGGSGGAAVETAGYAAAAAEALGVVVLTSCAGEQGGGAASPSDSGTDLRSGDDALMSDAASPMSPPHAGAALLVASAAASAACGAVLIAWLVEAAAEHADVLLADEAGAGTTVYASCPAPAVLDAGPALPDGWDPASAGGDDQDDGRAGFAAEGRAPGALPLSHRGRAAVCAVWEACRADAARCARSAGRRASGAPAPSLPATLPASAPTPAATPASRALEAVGLSRRALGGPWLVAEPHDRSRRVLRGLVVSLARAAPWAGQAVATSTAVAAASSLAHALASHPLRHRLAVARPGALQLGVDLAFARLWLLAGCPVKGRKLDAPSCALECLELGAARAAAEGRGDAGAGFDGGGRCVLKSAGTRWRFLLRPATGLLAASVPSFRRAQSAVQALASRDGETAPTAHPGKARGWGAAARSLGAEEAFEGAAGLWTERRGRAGDSTAAAWAQRQTAAGREDPLTVRIVAGPA